MDVRVSCPICGQSEVGSLPEHLQSHSKKSLIDILLVQHKQISKHVGPNSPVQILSRLESSVFRNKTSNPLKHQSEDQNPILLEFQTPTVENTSASTVTPLRVKCNATAIIPTKEAKAVANHVMQIDLESEDSNKSNISNHSKLSSAHEILKFTSSPPLIRGTVGNASYKENSGRPTFVLVDHTTITKPGPSRRRNSNENVLDKFKAVAANSEGQPNTSIIQYIIDESGQINDSPQEEPESWILADGRTIPVYSSLTQVPAVSDNTSAATMTVGVSTNRAHPVDTVPILPERNPTHNQMHLDLMTDEEIPPRGEISEYEESNASSILSEDSNIRPIGMLSESRKSPVVHEQNVFVSRKKKSLKTIIPQAQQYMCYECPQIQIFSSLFELAEHKFESHQNKLASTSANVTTSCSERDSVYTLPEKIRRQSQNDELDIPLQVPLADNIPITYRTDVDPITPVSSASLTKKEYFCVYCNYTSKKKNLLTQHMEAQHAGKPSIPSMFECTYCGKVFQARTNLRKHLLIHKERKYGCPTCPKGFTSNFKLMEHVRVHTKIYPFKCTGCDKTYRTPSLLNHHVKMAHIPECDRPAKRKLEFYCGVCHRVLHSKRSFKNHTQLHQEKPIKCSFCSETFTRHSVLVRHIRIAHDPQYESKASKDCPICHKKLHPNSIIKHMRIHSNEKPYSCNVCGKPFRTYANLTSHSWSHTNVEKPHRCRLCSKSYLFKKNLENHMMVHKKRTMHFVCNECGVKFTHKVNMKRHLEEHFKEKNHVCKVCGKAFQRNYYLIEHERIHTGVKPFTCSICGKASTTKSNHRAHLKIHDARETGNQEG